jgi:hypothetical protein
MKRSALATLEGKFAQDDRAVDCPRRASFEEFLREDARVPVGEGRYGPYSFDGREALLEVVRVLDPIIDGNLADARVVLAGGAQFGKTILELNLLAYLTSQRFLNVGLYLPDNDLVEGIVDSKLRPDVIDQIPWFARMVQVGKAVNESGKAMNRKGAFMVTDGKRRSTGMVNGLGKVPTSYTFDVTMEDEKDDIPEKNAKFVTGRMTSSQLRLHLIIGTQRVHGRGQEQAWTEGSQGVFMLGGHNPEEAFPGIVRCAVDGKPKPTDPKLTFTGDFRHDGDPNAVVATHDPENIYYLADPDTGAVLDRRAPVVVHREPARVSQRNWSIRISQLAIAAIDLSQIVGKWQLAVANSDHMEVFRCDVLALPKSTAQSISPAVIARAQAVEPFDLRLKGVEGRRVYGGIDVGDKCYFLARECESVSRRRAIYATSFPSADAVKRGEALFHQMGLSCLLIDQRPEANIARSLALSLNGLNEIAEDAWPKKLPKTKDDHLSIGRLRWNGRTQQWEGLRCAVVRFDKKQIGAGVEHGFDVFDEGGVTKFVPVIRCNREDAIDRVVRELLTPEEGTHEVIEGLGVRLQPSMLLPRRTDKIVETMERHFITGSERELNKDGEKGDYRDKCANHFLLANAYSALAEGQGTARKTTGGSFKAAPGSDRFSRGMASRRDRRLAA